MLRAKAGIGAVLFALLVTAADAQAASGIVYCVTSPAAPPGCTGTNETSFADALTAADADTSGVDQIVLPTGTQTGPSTGYQYTGKVPLEISGQGNGSVITLSSGSAAPVFNDVGTEPEIALRALSVNLPSGETAGGLALKAAAAVGNVSVTGASGSAGYGFAISGGGLLAGVSVFIPANTGSIYPAVFVSGSATTTVRDSFLSDRTGLEDSGSGTTTIHRCEIAGTEGSAAIIASGSSILADDSVIAATQGAIGLEASGTAAGATITATQLTIVGDNTATGVHVQGGPSGGNALVNLTDSIIVDPLANSIALFSAAGTGTATATTDYDDFDQKTILVGGTLTIGAHDFKQTATDPSGYVDPGFVDAAKGNYRLSPSSPLLSNDPTPIGQTPFGSQESSVDFADVPRITAGGRDLGAYQHQLPTVTATATATRVRLGAAISFAATGAIVYKNDPLAYSWHFDDGSTARGPHVSHTFATPGTHSAKVTATDLLGFAASETVTVDVTGGRPVISRVSQSASKWRAGAALARIAGRGHVPTGTTFSFRLNETAKVTFTFTGRGGLKRRLTFSGHAGRNTVHFDGRLTGHQELSPASYKLGITATEFGLTASARPLRFTIEPPPPSHRH